MSSESILWIGAGVGLGLLAGVRYARAKRAYADYKSAQGALSKAQQTMRASLRFVAMAGIFIAFVVLVTTARIWADHD